MNYKDIPTELTETLPIEEALRVLKFDGRSQFGSQQRHWGVIEVIAHPWAPIYCLLISINKYSEDIIYLPQERKIASKMKPIDILAIIYSACDSLFQYEDPPKELHWGQIYKERYWEIRRQEEEKRPKLWAEREFFRFCLNYIAQYNDWSVEDYDVDFTYSDGQLKIKAKDMEVCCPARGTFYGTLTFSARQLYRKMPKRFIDTSVLIIVWSNDRAIIASTLLPANWIEMQIQLKLAETKENGIRMPETTEEPETGKADIEK